MFAIRCKTCGNFPTIYNDSGCGSVFCKKCNSKKDFKHKEFFNFSNKFGKKKTAIEKWNIENER